ncbi:MAG TPA: cation:proton antiporter [Kofleriaceae bacterium]
MIDILLLAALTGLMQATRTFPNPSFTGGTELAFGYLLLAAFFTARIVSRVGLPKVTGYLLVGVLAGPYVLGLVSKEMAGSLAVINGVATCVLGLTAGGELDLQRVKPLLGTLRAVTLLSVMAAMVVLAVVVFVLHPLLPMFANVTFKESLAICAIVGVALSAQSPSVVMALLAETKADGPISRMILATVVVADLVVVIIYSIVAAVAGAVVGGGLDLRETVMSIGWELFGSMAFGVAIGMLIGRYLMSVERGAALFALMVCVVVAEIGEAVHLDPLIVMLAAGVWLKNFSRADANALLHGFEAAELPVFLVFFSLAGCKLNIFDLWSMAVPVVVIAAARAAVFYYGTRRACEATHADPAVTRYGWTGLVPQAGLSFVLVVVIQKNFPTFGAAAAVLLLSVVGINQVFAPVLLRISLVRSGEAGKKLLPDAAHAVTT